MSEQTPDRISIDPTPERFSAFMERVPDDAALVMLNLLRFRAQADYPGGEHEGSGREAYERYGAAVEPFLAHVGGRLVWQGEAHGALIAPEGERWDLCLLVEYPSKGAFLAMVGDPGYQAIAMHRTAALADSRLIPTVKSG